MVISTKQSTSLGSLGLEAIATRFCGPNFNLSDVLVEFYRNGESILVSFYDMNVYIKPDNRLYARLDTALMAEEKGTKSPGVLDGR
jgi:hypothetical protein